MEMVAPAREVLRFECFMLDLRRRELMTVGGRCVPIEGKRFDLLAFLVSRRDEAVSRDEILASVWGGRAVSEGLVSVQMHELRKALKQAGCERQVIITLPNQRYRFVGEAPAPDPEALPFVPTVVPDPAPAPRGRRWLVFVSAAVLALVVLGLAAVLHSGIWGGGISAPRFSIVVLPFRNLGNDRGQDYLATNVTDDLIADLAHIPASTVIARETAEAVRTDSPQQIGTRLRVRYILAGTLFQDGSKYHVTAHLIDTGTGAQLWDASYVDPQDSLAAAQAYIVTHIASALQLRLDQLESTRSLHDRPGNPDALDLFYRARAVLDYDDSAAGLAHAQEMLEQARALEPGFADAGAALGWLLLKKAISTDDEDALDRDWLRAQTVIDETLRIAPRNALAIAAKARELFVKGKYREAAATAETARFINESSVEAYRVLANCAWKLGQLDAEASYVREIQRLNPEGMDSKSQYKLLGIVRLLQMKTSEAIELLQQSVSGDPEPLPGAESLGRAELARAWLIAAYGMSGDLSEARSRYEEYNRVWPHRSVWRFGAYLPKAVTAMPSAQLVLKALHDAGMPQVADERTSTLSSEVKCGEDVYGPTPLTLDSGGRVIETAEIDRMLSAVTVPLVIDVGEGKDSIPIAHWYDPAGPAENRAEFALRLVANRDTKYIGQPVIVMGDGPFGCTSFDAAMEIISHHYKDIYWYRGGEEAWANSGHATRDFRPE